MRLVAWLAITLLFATIPAPSAARDASTFAAYDRCMSHAGGFTDKMIDCARDNYPIQHAAMQKAYRAALRRLSPARGRQLAERQRRWMAELPAHCKDDPDVKQFGDGTLATLLYYSCFPDQVAKRAKWLRHLGRAPK